MRKLEFIQMMYMSNPKVEWSKKNDSRSRDSGDQVEWNDDRSKDDFLSDRSCNIVAVARPAGKSGNRLIPSSEASQILFDEDNFEKWSSVEQEYQRAGFEKLQRLDGPPA